MLKSIFMSLPKNLALRSLVIFMAIALPYIGLFYTGIISQLPELWMFILWLVASIVFGFVSDENGLKNPFIR
ncbi:hypothetical protein GCM10007978_04950 [Shewanella hanedai]|nr:hypothetical protein GCM10007978_04950 [Shewanella hanedai]